ncbi:hypothetical protein PInf_003259 [Phytophthora infestans]|nr:hypothetical protein PInf_003259 [Phytophthora infestans]
MRDLFGTSSESKAGLSQSTVTRAFDLPPEGLLLDASQLEEAAAILQLLSNASGAESGAEEEDDSDESDGVAYTEEDEGPDRGDDACSDYGISDGDAVDMDEAFIASLQLDIEEPDRRS